MSHAERAYAGPNFWGRTFLADHCQHVATRDEHLRRQRLDREKTRAEREHARNSIRKH